MCNGRTTKGAQCTRKAEWCFQHLDQKPAEPINEEFVASIRKYSFEPIAEEPIAEEPIAEEPIAEEPIAEEPVAEEPVAKKNETQELIVADEEIVSEDIVPTMSPNATTDIATQPEPVKVQESKSEPVENNSSYTNIEVFNFKEVDDTHEITDTVWWYKALYRALKEEGSSIEFFNKGEMNSLMDAGKYCVQYPFFLCSEAEFDEAKSRPKIKDVLRLVFDSEDDFEVVEVAMQELHSKVSEIELILRLKDYDEYLYDLCKLISPNWFRDRDNMWGFTRMVYQMQGDSGLYRRTYAVILAHQFGKSFNEKSSMTSYDLEGPETKYRNKITIGSLKAVAGGSNPDGYRSWKAKHEPEPVKIEKPKKEAAARVSDNDTLRNAKLLELIAKATSIPAEELKAAITDDSIDFAFEWCERYIKPTNRPIVDDFHKWGLIVKYMHCYKFPDDESAAKMLAMVIDLYFVIMVNGERYRRVDLSRDESNAEMTKEIVDPLKSMLFHINSRDKPVSASALMVQQLPYFHMYESFIVSFERLGDNSDTSVFNSCIPFKAQIVECDADYSICDDIFIFIREIICDNDESLYNQMMTWLAKMVQYPDSKTEMLPILYSALEGCGKTCFTDLLLAIFGIHSVDVSAGSIDSLVNERRSHLIGKKLCIVNEVREMKNSFGQNHEALKSLLTDKLMSARPLYANKITVKNVLEVIITTNNLATIPSGRGARRLQIFQLNDKRCQDKAYFKNLYENSINNSSVINAFYTYLMREIKVKRGPMDGIVQTEAQQEFRETTEDNVARFWNHVLTDLVGVDEWCKPDAYSNYTRWCETQGEQPMRLALFGSNTKGIRFIKDKRTKTARFWQIVRDSV